MGPTSTVYFSGPLTDDRLELVDAVLARLSSDLKRTRKGRYWSVRIEDRPVDVHIEESTDSTSADPVTIVLAAGCNEPQDYGVVAAVAAELSRALNGHWTEPTK